MRKVVLSSIAGAGWLLVSGITARGSVYYVSADGNDASNGTSWAAAKLTIQAGVNLAAVAGDTVMLGDGTYPLTLGITVAKAITVTGASGNREAVIVDGNSTGTCFTVSAAATLSNMTIKNGRGALCGGVTMNGGATVSNIYFYSNIGTADPGPGAIYLNHLSGLVADCVFDSNRASTKDGGAVTMYKGTVHGSVFTNNYASRWGGAVRMDGGTLFNCRFVGNYTASGQGPGALQMRTGSPVVSNCYFFGNYSWSAGAVAAASGWLYNSLIVSNYTRADSSGGGISINGALVERCVIMHNRVISPGGNDGGGGAIGSGTLRNCLIVGNQAIRSGGGLRVDGGVIENCTIVGNKAGSDGGVWARSGRYYNTIVYSNSPNSTTASVISNSCTYPLASGAGNVSGYPLFVRMGSGYGTNHVAGDYRLRKGSPCVNSGMELDWMGEARDLDGLWRIFGSAVDMGAYEYTVPLGTVFLIR